VRIKTFLALALAGALSMSAAVATTVGKKMDLSELTKSAPVAIVGKIVASRTAKTDAGVITITTVAVENSLWGTDATTVEVEVPGGSETRGKFKLNFSYPGAPVLLNGRKAMFLLTPASDSKNFSVVGFNQGVFAVVNDAVMLPGASRTMPLSAAMSEVRAARAQPESSNGLR
jgi:hypothetical protein